MRCAACDCHSTTAQGWVATLTVDPDDVDATPSVVTFCPPCAAREFAYASKVAYT